MVLGGDLMQKVGATKCLEVFKSKGHMYFNAWKDLKGKWK
jgi:acyl-CoA-binding protein